MKMRADRKRVLEVLCDPAVLVAMQGAALDMTLRQLRRLKLLAHVAIRLRERQLLRSFSNEVQDQFASAMAMAEARARLARWELDRIAQVLQPGDAFPVLALKGCAYLLRELPLAAGRMLTDVDLLVPQDRLIEVEERLCQAGWESTPLKDYDDHYYRHWAHEIPPLRHAEREIEVDVHHNILMRTARLKPRPALLLKEARPVGNAGYSTLCSADMVLHAMTHLFCSSEQDDALRELVDIDALLRYCAAQDPQFWGQLAERAQALDLMRPAWYALRYASRWLDTPVPDAVLQAFDAARPFPLAVWLMDHLVPGALFARNPDRADRTAGYARTLLLVRVHWLRMPPGLLLMHLSRKLMRRVKSGGSQPS
jgi:hypothetical protein